MWICSCGMHNIGTAEVCANQWFYKDCRQISSNVCDWWNYTAGVEDSIGFCYGHINIDTGKQCMTPEEELFVGWYNKGKILVVGMDDTQLREHIEQLSKVVAEGKAHLQAAREQLRERGAKKKASDKEWLVPVDETQTVSDAINVVKTRASRMNKIEKTRRDLEKLNMDADTINEIIRGLEQKATERSLKTVSFKVATVEDKAIQVEVANTNGDSNGNEFAEKKPFDPKTLKFGK